MDSPGGYATGSRVVERTQKVSVMLDYSRWLQQAAEFTNSLQRLPGTVTVETKVARPLSEAEIGDIARSCHLSIPEPLRRFWGTACGHCTCTYHWKLPEEFHSQLSVVTSRFRDTV